MSYAQANSGSGIFSSTLLVIAGLLFLAVIFLFGENLLQLEAKRAGIKSKDNNFSILPGIRDIFREKLPDFVDEDAAHVLKKGFDIQLEGDAAPRVIEANIQRFALKPQEFNGISPIPKVEVTEGDTVKAGDVLFYDKKYPEVKYVAPVSGEVIEIKRGEKRSISSVEILADKEQQYRSYQLPDLGTCSRPDLVNFLLSSGAWPLFNQRPYDIVPAADQVPVNIFISSFDSAPLAPDSRMIIEGNEKAFQAGIDVLNKLTSGKVHLSLNAGADKPARGFMDATGVEKHWFKGPHPAGNVGVQIHHIAPIRGADKVWTISVQNAITLGRLFSEGRYDTSRLIAIAGKDVQGGYVKTYQGAHAGELLSGKVSNEHVRVISGDVLTGTAVTDEQYLDFNANQVTVVEEGDKYKMFGWLIPFSTGPTASRAMLNAAFSDLKYAANTNTNGERRAFVVTGQYEKMLPMDIYPQALMKAIMAGDFERMEGLGINELSEEDIALAEFACTSKMPLQSILREGLEMMRAQG